MGCSASSKKNSNSISRLDTSNTILSDTSQVSPQRTKSFSKYNRKYSQESIDQSFEFEDMNDEEKAIEQLCQAWMQEFGSIKFPSLIAGKRLWYLDEFRPKGSKEKIRMWKEAVVDILDSSHDCVHLKLSPMNKKRDRLVDLKTQWGRLALPDMNLSKEQRIKGTPLSDEQLQRSYYLLTSEYAYDEELRNVHEETYEEDKKGGGFDDLDFSIGKEVDVQDVFLSKERKEIQSKWRKAKIIAINHESVRVHYIGLDDRWDENIDLNRDGDRVRPSGTMTALQLGSIRTQINNTNSTTQNQSNGNSDGNHLPLVANPNGILPTPRSSFSRTLSLSLSFSNLLRKNSTQDSNNSNTNNASLVRSSSGTML